MEIKNDSWHHWLYEVGHCDTSVPQRTNLCKYFWRVMAGILVVTATCIICTSAVVGIGVMFYLHTFLMFAVLGGIAALVGLFYLYWRHQERAWKRRNIQGYQEPEPGLVFSYLKAKKDKVCPLVTIVNTECK